MSIYNPDDFYENYQAGIDPDPDFYDDDEHQEIEEDEYNTPHTSDEPDGEEQMDEIEEEDPNFYFDDEDDGSAPDPSDD